MSYYVTGTKQQVTKHIEGDVWEESGKTWTIKNGIKRTVNKFDEVRKQHIMPLACPCCNKSMKSEVNKVFWATHRMCLDCVVDLEHKILKAGKWEEYEKAKVKANAISFYGDLESFIEEFKNETTNIVTEDGVKETWIDPTAQVINKIGKDELNQMQNFIKEI
jgi:hypothetical protein